MGGGEVFGISMGKVQEWEGIINVVYVSMQEWSMTWRLIKRKRIILFIS